MNLRGLINDAERRLRRAEKGLAFDALTGDARRLDKRRYVLLRKLHVQDYVQPGETIALHRSLLPQITARDEWGIDRQTGELRPEWNMVTVDRIGDCVRVFVAGVGSHPIPLPSFVEAVMHRKARELVNGGLPPAVIDAEY